METFQPALGVRQVKERFEVRERRMRLGDDKIAVSQHFELL
jgi:hypothetical protein